LADFIRMNKTNRAIPIAKNDEIIVTK
jgi:hypothetical protein